MDYYQLEGIVNRRGYVLKPPGDSWHPVEVERAGTCIGAFSQHILDDLTVGDVTRTLDQWVSIHHPMQHHMQCTHCHTPLLHHVNTDEATKLLMNSVYPIMGDIMQNPRIADAIHTEYRSAVQGPNSAPLTTCLICMTPLNTHTVSEIEDDSRKAKRHDASDCTTTHL